MTQLTARAASFMAVRDKAIDQAIAARKIRADQRDKIVQQYNAMPEAMWNLLNKPPEEGGLMAGLVHEHIAETIDETGYPPTWLPELEARSAGGVTLDEGVSVTAGRPVEQPPKAIIPPEPGRIMIEPVD